MGFVYIIKDIEVSGLCKIGHTNNPARRVYDFGVILPFKTMVVLLYETPNAPKLEHHMHVSFAKKRTNGEWFKLTDLDITYIHSMLELVNFRNQLTPEQLVEYDARLALEGEQEK